MSDLGYYTLVTTIGKSKIANAAATGQLIKAKNILFGDGGGAPYNPTEGQTALKNEVYRSPVSDIYIHKVNKNWVVVEGFIPVNQGGFFIREVGVEDEDGDLIVIGSRSEVYKPTLSENEGTDLYQRVIFVVSNTSSIKMDVDPSIAVATRPWVEEAINTVSPKLISARTAAIDMKDNVLNIARADGYKDAPLFWSQRSVVLIGDSHGWGEGAPNYQGAGSGYSVHSPWIHNKGFFGRLVDHLHQKFDTEPWRVVPYPYRSVTGSRKGVMLGRDHYPVARHEDIYTKLPLYARGRFDVYRFAKDNGNNFSNRDIASSAAMRGDTYALSEYKYLSDIGLFSEYQFEMAPDIPRENEHSHTIRAWAGLVVPGGWQKASNNCGGIDADGCAFVHIYPHSETYHNKWFYVGQTLFLSGIGAKCKVKWIDSYNDASNRLHTNVGITYEDDSNLTLSDVESLRDGDTLNRDFEGQGVVVIDLERPTRYVVLGVCHVIEGAKVKIDLLPDYEWDLYSEPAGWGDANYGTSNVSIKALTASGGMENVGDYAVVDNSNFKITIDSSKAAGYFIPYVIDFGQKKKGRLRIRYAGDGDEATGVRSWSGTTVFTCKGALINNLDYVKNWSMGGHTIGAWLGQEASYWNETRNHVADIKAYTPVRATAVIVEAPLVNEWLKQTPLATFKQRLTDLANEFNQGNVLIFNTLGTHDAEFGSDSKAITFSDYANAVREWAETAGGKVTFLDCRRHLKDMVENGHVKAIDLYHNNGHPSPMSNEIMFEHLKRLVDMKL